MDGCGGGECGGVFVLAPIKTLGPHFFGNVVSFVKIVLYSANIDEFQKTKLVTKLVKFRVL